MADDGTRVRPQERTVSTVPADLLDAYAGRYRFSNGEVWTVRRDGPRFFVKKPTEPEVEVFPEGDFVKGSDDFFSKTADAMFTFDFDKENPRLASQLAFHWSFLEPRVGKRVQWPALRPTLCFRRQCRANDSAIGNRLIRACTVTGANKLPRLLWKTTPRINPPGTP